MRQCLEERLGQGEDLKHSLWAGTGVEVEQEILSDSETTRPGQPLVGTASKGRALQGKLFLLSAPCLEDTFV